MASRASISSLGRLKLLEGFYLKPWRTSDLEGLYLASKASILCLGGLRLWRDVYLISKASISSMSEHHLALVNVFLSKEKALKEPKKGRVKLG